MSTPTARMELIQIADAVAREKSIDRAVVLHAMQEAIERVARFRYGMESDIRAVIDPISGETQLTRLLEVVESVENPAQQITLESARSHKEQAKVGDFISERLPPIEFGRASAQSAKQIIIQNVRAAERERTYETYVDRVGEIVSGQVRRVEYGSVYVDLDRGDAIIRRFEQIPREDFRYGDRVRAYIYEVRREARGPQIFLSRTHPQFMARLFAMEVPEIYDGIIEIKAVARDPGSRAKIAVLSHDSAIDPVGACVGLRGSRVQAIVGELQGEKIDIIPWSPDPATFIVNALQPAEVAKVVLEEERTRIEVVVPEDQLSLAIGRRGQNVRLASQLSGWDIDILTESEESDRRQSEFEERSRLFMEALNVDEVVSQLLASEGFSAIYELAYVALEELASIEGFEADTAAEIQARAKDYLEKDAKDAQNRIEALRIESALVDLEPLTAKMLIALGESGVRTLADFADCARDDLIGWVEEAEGERKNRKGILSDFNLSAAEADDLILRARTHLGWIPPDCEADSDSSAHAQDEAETSTPADSPAIGGAEAASPAGETTLGGHSEGTADPGAHTPH